MRRGRALKNVSKNRPDATNLNHQNANRRAFMSSSRECGLSPLQ
jgi:hypothetical protein